MNSRRPLLLAADAAGDRRWSLYGYDTAIVGSALTFVPYGLHGPAHGYLVSGASPGGAAGAILAGLAADRFGRKKLLIADAGRWPYSSSGRSPSASWSPTSSR